MPSLLVQLIRHGVRLALVSACASTVLAQTPPPAEAPVARFDIIEYRVLGNTVLPRERIERAVVPFLGEKRGVADVEAARQALENAYREAGFGTVLVDTPEQRVTGGVIALQVVEAAVSRLRVTGAKYYSQGRILDKVPALAEGSVPNFNEVSTQLGFVNRSADRRVTPLLRPGKTPGTTEVDLQVDDRSPLHGSLELNNKHGPNTTASRLVGALRYDNLWQREHSLGVQVQVSPQETGEVKVVAVSYTVPEGLGLWVLSGVRSKSSTLVKANDMVVVGDGTILGVRRVFYDLDEKLTQSVTLGADYKDMAGFNYQLDANGNFVRTTDCSQVLCTPIRYAPLSASYSATANRKASITQAGAGLVLGLRALASGSSQFAEKRYGAQPNFTVLRIDASRLQKLRNGMEFYAKAEGLVGSQPLISDEQFIAGGADSVRGYLEAASAGDKGLRVSFEARSPNFMRDRKEPLINDLRAHVFLEGAGTWLKMPLPGQDQREGLLSTGVGMRLKVDRRASLALDVAHALHDGGGTNKGSTRVHATGVIEF